MGPRHDNLPTRKKIMTCSDPDCSCHLVGRDYKDLTDHEKDIFTDDDDLDLCTICNQVNTVDELGVDDFRGDVIGVCETCR